ncbi:MAG TPA: phosphatidate cytidylyltransferase [Roseiflexaceae bacterium]|nr:phosphatidate cytidylyltransferase [Roseiflexaceae bacterium]
MDSANAASAASPRNNSSLAQRVLSAVLLLPLIIVLVWWNVWSVAATVMVATAIGLLELYAAFRQGGYQPRVAVGIGSALAIILALALQSTYSLDLILPVLTFTIIVSLIAELSYENQPGSLPSWGLTIAGAFYVAWLLGHFILLRSLGTPLRDTIFKQFGMQPGVAWIYCVCAVTWLQDTGAYFVGRRFGRHKMAPILSPKKTWEGAVGGMLAAIIAGIVCVLLLGLPITLLQGALLGVVGGVVGPLGDLSESLIKRQVGLKDAGNLIPGHGGLLDRVDSLLFSVPILYYLIVLFTSY